MAGPNRTPTKILLISGSLRAGSTNLAVLRTAQELAPPSASLSVYAGLADLTHFNLDLDIDPLPSPAASLRQSLADADGVLFSVPEYAGTLPGSLKNLLDWTVGGGLQKKPVGYINASLGAQGAHQTLRVVLRYVDAEIVEPACVQIPIRRDAINARGTVEDPGLRESIREVVNALVRHIENQPQAG